MKLKQFLKAARGQVCGGSDYQWDCFPDGQFMDVSDLDGNEVAGCIFSRKSQLVYQVEVHVYDDKVAYRWIDPDWMVDYGSEAERRKVDKMNAYDDTNFTDVESEDEILHLLSEVVSCTYVHSKPIFADKDAPVVGLNPAAAWPFPKGQTTGFVGDDGSEDLGEPNRDAGTSAEQELDDINELFNDFDSDSLGGPQTEFEVVLTVRHRFSVKAETMEGAIGKAKEFNKNFRNGGWPEGLIWEDQWISKETATRRLETVNIED